MHQSRLLLLAALAVLNGEVLAHGAIDERIAGVERRIVDNPNDPMLYLRRADLYREHRDWDSAFSDIMLAAEVSPGNPNIEYYRALLLRDLGKLPEAERAFGRYIERAPAWNGPKVPLPKAHQMLAGTLVDQDRPCEAAVQYNAAIAAAQRSGPQLYLSRAEQLMRCSPPDYEAAIRGLDEGIARLGPGAGVLEDYAIDLELARGTVERALERQDVLLARSPQLPGAWIRRAEILEQANRPAESLAAYRRAQTANAAMPERARATPAFRALNQKVNEAIHRLSPESGSVLDFIPNDDQ